MSYLSQSLPDFAKAREFNIISAIEQQFSTNYQIFVDLLSHFYFVQSENLRQWLRVARSEIGWVAAIDSKLEVETTSNIRTLNKDVLGSNVGTEMIRR